ncbi:MAG: ABC transporter permease subunit [Planctomycetota bacterium]|jgi:hypothetical protein
MPPVKFIGHIREVMAGPLCRHEARMASRPRAMAVYYGLAGLFDAGGLLAMVLTALGLGGDVGADVIVILSVGAGVTGTSVAAAVALMIPAMAGEKENGTLEAMLLTSVSRRALLWGKLMGRTAPVRRMLVAAFPAFLWCGVSLLLRMGGGPYEYGRSGGVLAVYGCMGAMGAVAWWVLTLIAAHCAAAAALYFSARAKSPLTATATTGLGVLAPPLALGCCYGIGAVYLFVAGPILFSELIRSLDKFTIGQE